MNWPMVQLQDLALPKKGSIVSGPFGSNIGSRFFVEEGIPVIRGNNLTVGRERFVDEGFVFLTEEKASEFKNCEAIKDDIIFTAAGTIGQVGLIPENTKFEKYIISNKQLRVRIDTSKANPVFVYYWLTTREMNRHIIGLNNGGAVPLINLSIIRKLPVPLPPYEKQEKIVSIISAYDSLIENNRRRIQLLEQSARMLYREWFVHLRFPGHEHVRIIDGVPEGWKKKQLVDIAILVMGQSPKSEFYNEEGEGLPFHQGVTNFGDRFINHEFYCTVKNRLANPGDILCSVRAPVGRLNVTLDKIVIGRGLAAILSKSNHQSFLYYQLKNHFFKEDMIGGGAIFASVTKKDMENQEFMYPTEGLVKNFEEISVPIDNQIKTLHIQNERLNSARDILLPRLMNGEIAV